MEKLAKMICAMLVVLTSASVYAEPENYLVLDTGYRWDSISNRASIAGPTVTVVETTQSLKKINSYQLGAKGQWSCGCNSFIRASAHYGWIGGAKYDEAGFKGKAVGNTWDAKVAFGYNFCLNPCLNFAPIVGWSTDHFELTGKKIRVDIDGRTRHLSNIKANQRFNGPFIGFDILLQPFCCFDVLLGYELHYTRWNGDRIIKGHEYGNPPFGTTTGFSNKRHLHGAIGNVIKFGTTYRICGNWIAGLQLNYKLFKGDFGKYKRTKTPLIPQFTFAHVDDLEWHSFAAMIQLGTTF